MSKEYVVEKLAAMTTAMRDNSIAKIKDAIVWHQTLGRYGETPEFLSNLESAIKKEELGAKLFLQQKNSQPVYDLEKQLRKNFTTIYNLKDNRNIKGDFLGVDDELYKTLANTPATERKMVKRKISEYLMENMKEIPMEFRDNKERFLKTMLIGEDLKTKIRGSNIDYQTKMGLLNVKTGKNMDESMDNFRKKISDREHKQQMMDAAIGTAVIAALGGGGYYLYKKKKEKQKK